MKNVRITIPGWAQITKKATMPIPLMKEVVLSACDRTRQKNILNQIDGLMTVMPLSSNIPSAADELAKQLKIKPKLTFNSGIGGHSPQYLVNKAAGMIAREELKTVLIVGAETFYPKNGVKSSLFQGISKCYQEDDIVGSTELENIYGISMPLDGFPLFEIALWANSGLSFKEYLSKIGKLLHSFSEVAHKHKNSWIKKIKSIDSILSPSEINPIISFPYTKFMCPFISVDMGAAIILSSEKRISSKSNVYFIGGGYSEDRQRFLVEKSNFISSPPLKSAVNKSLNRSGLSIEDIKCFDLYSCFPCAVFIAKKILKIREEDERPLTLTGGLANFGGPGSNYSLHAIATLISMINSGAIKNGMITSLGWFMHKHSVGIYSHKPTNRSMIRDDLEDKNDFLSGDLPLKIVKNFTGQGVIDTYCVQKGSFRDWF